MYIFLFHNTKKQKKCSWTDLASNDEYEISEMWVTMYNIIPGSMPKQYNSIYNLYNHTMKKYRRIVMVDFYINIVLYYWTMSIII